MSAPGYWMAEISGRLALSVHAYLRGDGMSASDIAYMRAYLRQWINADGWYPSPALDELRRGVNGLDSREKIIAWLHNAELEGIDPL